ncbi:zinc finger HIT domain-containing protein 3 isoform X2, putative [Babesia ovis]|uniref:Zinc finger HIT domain-containing protein 3 isoform X2, putative n=1 Tax=Babesia ovis TaxID=5869 RepID=A0A9W5TD78_BABOV|nr:zinc finger HIT domain-containing protein 3 isoform X2, putative [Babesia ovis]
MVCVECNADAAPYRFKCCGRNFCSVPCYKTHSCVVEAATTGANEPHTSYVVPESTKTEEVQLTEAQVEALKGDEKLRSMLSNDTLRKVLRTVVSSPDPLSAMAPYMHDEFFSGFVTQVMDTLGNADEPRPNDNMS